MINQELLYKICETFQKTLESEVGNVPTGTCYLSGFCLNEFFKRNGLNSKFVTGSLALIDKNGKYAIYGKLKLPKGKQVGTYHAWCEVTINDKVLIVDPSQKYNIYALKKYYNIKVSPKVLPITITEIPITYYWKYHEDEALAPLSNYFLKLADKELIQIIDYSLQTLYSI